MLSFRRGVSRKTQVYNTKDATKRLLRYLVFRVQEMDIDFFVPEFIAKCEAKDIDPYAFHKSIEKRLPQYKGRWDKSMADQIQDLPPFEKVEREMSRHLKKFNV